MSARQTTVQEASVPEGQTTLAEYAPDLGALSHAEQAAYQSVRLGDYTPAEYAHDTGRKPSTVRTLLYRANAKLEADNGD